MTFTKCPLCSNESLEVLNPKNDDRVYAYCDCCGLIHAHPSFKVSVEAEKQRYLEHNNTLEDPRYLNFLNKIVATATKYLSPEMIGVDYGCGPVAGIELLLQNQKVECLNYDPIFYPNFPQGAFDFVFSSECFEHFNNTREEIEKVLDLLQPSGFLFVMTQVFHSTERFMNWYYKRDQTHVSFFSMKTWEFLCQKYNLKLLEHDGKRIFILQKISD